MPEYVRKGRRVNRRVYTPGGYPGIVERVEGDFAIVRVERKGMKPYTRRFRIAALTEWA